MELGNLWLPHVCTKAAKDKGLQKFHDATDPPPPSGKRLLDSDSCRLLKPRKKFRRSSRYICNERSKVLSIPCWELNEADVKQLEPKYIVARTLSSAEVKREINDLLVGNLFEVLDGNGYSFQIPSCEKDDLEHLGSMEESEHLGRLEWLKELSFPLLKRGRHVTRSFTDERCTRTATMTVWVLSRLYKLVQSGMKITIRDLFYQNAVLFRDQKTSNAILVDITRMVGCTRRSLNVESEQCGSVCGMIQIEFNDGETMPLCCSKGASIPDDISDISCFTRIGCSELHFILVVEKGTIYNYLRKSGFHKKHKCIMITSNGMPDIATRSFLKCLHLNTNIDIYGICDPDPDGFQILKIYDQGSVNLAHENLNLAVPHLVWLGMTLEDIYDAGLILDEANSTELKPRDMKILDNLLTDNYINLPRFWRTSIKQMRAVGRKAHFEIFHAKGFAYVADVLLPSLINRAKEDQYRVAVPSVAQERDGGWI